MLGTTLGAMDGIPIGTYDALYLGCLEGSTYGEHTETFNISLLVV